MKKFIKMLLCMCLCVVSFAFTACGGSGKIDAPASSAEISGNGGAVVQKGDYLYFANGYTSLDNVNKDNIGDKRTFGGLYVTKLNSNGSRNADDNGSLQGMDRLSSKLAGFEATDLHIFGDYMYFTTIKTEETNKGQIEKERLEIYRIKLNGDDLDRVYRASSNYEDSEGNRIVTFDYFNDGENFYILINDNGSLKHITCNSKSIGGVSDVADEVKSLVVPEDNNGADIFFTTVDDDIYEISRYNVFTNKVTTKTTCDKNDIIGDLFASKFNNLYFYATFEDVGNEFLYCISFDDFADGVTFASSKKLTSTSYSAIYLLDSYLDGILLISSSMVEIANPQNPTSSLDLQENMPSDATIISVQGGYVYFYTDSTFKRWNYTNDTVETIYSETNTICNYHFDIQDGYLYYFATCGSHDYLYRVNVADGSSEKTAELIGQYASEDIPETDEEDDD